MYKVLVRLSLVLLLVAGSTLALSENEMMKSVYKIRTYIQNPISGDYELYAIGSATRITANRILTNAHVILGEKDAPSGLYEICRMIATDRDPSCFSVGKLVSYDIVADLAVLEVADAGPALPLPRVISKSLNTGDKMIVYGYPDIGGKSITRTEGKIAGIENDDYKFDGSIDHGNSGGAAFDNEGNLIGVPYAVSSDNAVIGYIIPSRTVRKFFDGKTDNYIKIEKSEYDALFQKYIKRVQNLYKYSSFVETPYVSITNLSSGDFILRNAAESVNGKEYLYLFSNKNNRVNLMTGCGIGGQNYSASLADTLNTFYESIKSTNPKITVNTETNGDIFSITIKNDLSNGSFSLFSLIQNQKHPACTSIVSSSDFEKDKKNIAKALEIAKNIRFKKSAKVNGSFTSSYFSAENIPEGLQIAEGFSISSMNPEIAITAVLGKNVAVQGSLNVYTVDDVRDYMYSSDAYLGTDFSYENFLARYRFYSDDPVKQAQYKVYDFVSKNGKRFLVDTFISDNDDGIYKKSSYVTMYYPFKLGDKYYYYKATFDYSGESPAFVQKIADLFKNAILPGESPFSK